MSKVEEYKKTYPHFNINYIDIFKKLDKSKTGKYLPLFTKILTGEISRRVEDMEKYTDYVKEKLNNYGFDHNGLSQFEMFTVCHLIEAIGENPISSLIEFMDYMERGYIDNKDVLTYKSMDQVKNAISVASLKEHSKELENQIKNEFEDDTWIILRPLSWEASSKYGASTKWCVTYRKDKEYFAKYFSKGVLVFFINKKTGYKFALYSEVYNEFNEITFWNAEDSRVDFLSLDVDFYLLPKIKELANSKIKNSDYLSEEEKEKVFKECKYVEYKGDFLVPPDELLVENITLQEPQIDRVGDVYIHTYAPESAGDDFPTPTETLVRA